MTDDTYMKVSSTWNGRTVTIEQQSLNDDNIGSLTEQIKGLMRGLGYAESTVNEAFGDEEEGI